VSISLLFSGVLAWYGSYLVESDLKEGVYVGFGVCFLGSLALLGDVGSLQTARHGHSEVTD